MDKQHSASEHELSNETSHTGANPSASGPNSGAAAEHLDPGAAFSAHTESAGIDLIQADLERFRDLALRSQADFESGLNQKPRIIDLTEKLTITATHGDFTTRQPHQIVLDQTHSGH